MRHGGKVYKRFADIPAQNSNKKDSDSGELIILVKQQKRDFKEAAADVEQFVRHFKVAYEEFEQMRVLSDLWLQKSIMSEKRLDIADYNLGLMFKILISGDRSMFYNKKAAEIQAKQQQKRMKPGQT